MYFQFSHVVRVAAPLVDMGRAHCGPHAFLLRTCLGRERWNVFLTNGALLYSTAAPNGPNAHCARRGNTAPAATRQWAILLQYLLPVRDCDCWCLVCIDCDCNTGTRPVTRRPPPGGAGTSRVTPVLVTSGVTSLTTSTVGRSRQTATGVGQWPVVTEDGACGAKQHNKKRTH